MSLNRDSDTGRCRGITTGEKSCRKQKTPPKRGSKLVGERGFEPPTHWSQTSCATKLRYSPMYCFFEFLVQFIKKSWCEGGDSNPHILRTLTPEASASTNSATFAIHNSFNNGVANGIRTHDNWNHNPGLYQLSYSHHCILSRGTDYFSDHRSSSAGN